MNIALVARDIDVGAQKDVPAAVMNLSDKSFELTQELHLCDKIFSAIGHVHGAKKQIADLRCDDAGFEVEFRMGKNRLVSKSVAAQMQANAGIGARAMPVAAIALHLAKSRRHLGDSRFDLLQANYVGLLALDPFEQLRLARADTVNVPSSNFE